MTRRAEEITELRNRLAVTETASVKAKDELALSLSNAEKLKKDFEAERTAWEVQRNALEKRAKDAEKALNPVTQELTGLRQQIELMTFAIFGKYLYAIIFAIFILLRFNFNNHIQGDASPILGMTSGRNSRPLILWLSSCIPALRGL